MRITYLADHPQHVSTVSKWVMGEWGHESPGTTLESLEEKFRTRLNRDSIPLTLLAMENDRLLGTASLVIHDMKDHRELSPRLAAVYVVPELRGGGIGSRLVKSIELLSANFEVEKLYLFTPDRKSFYTRMKWRVLEKTQYHEKDVVIMVKDIL